MRNRTVATQATRPDRAGLAGVVRLFRPASFLLFVLMVAGMAPLFARGREGDHVDAVAGLRRLRELTRRLGPLADTGSGITRDVGSISIIEHDGSNYNMYDDTGTPNYPARAAVAQRFYQAHGDNYDFLLVFTNFEFNTGPALAFHNLIRNHVQGIGKPIADGGSEFGSPGRLLGYVDMAAVSRYRQNGLSLDYGDPGFSQTLNTVAHEIGHQWLASPKYVDAEGNVSSALIGKDGSHWSYLLDSDASFMYGADWTLDGTGTYVAKRVEDAYSSLDLYLMGFLDPAKVGPITLLRNPSIDPKLRPVEGARISATPETVTMEQIVAAEGERSPNFRNSPKELRIGFVFLTSPGTEPTEEDLAAVERVRQAFATHFFSLTRGIAITDTALAEAPPQPHPVTPDLDKALAWLLSQQASDGHWEDASYTTVRDTTTVVEALATSGQYGVPYQKALQWASAVSVRNLDAASRRYTALAKQLPASINRTALAAWLIAQQNSDGGFGLVRGYESDPLDTALVLLALKDLDYPYNAAVRNALTALGTMRAPSGGWASVLGSDSSTVATAQILLSLQDWSTASEAQALLAPGLAALLLRRNPDGGFGESPSTPYATALSLDVLLRARASQDVVNGAISFLQQSQLLDGSWDGSAYQTALVLNVLRGATAANLVIPGDSVQVDPPSAREGDTVRVTARVRNTGRSPAGASHGRLFDGDPAKTNPVAEASVPALDPGADAEVSFDFLTTDHVGDRVLYVVADASNEVAESREDDNSSWRSLHVEGLLADLTIALDGIVVAPNPPEDGEIAEVGVTVRNQGERAAPSSTVILVDGNPRLGGKRIGQEALPALQPGQSAAVTIDWNTAGARGTHLLYAVADADYTVSESNKYNNEAWTSVEVTGPLPPGPDLAIGQVTLSPNVLSTIPQSGEASVVVENLGRDAATSEVALYDGDPASAPIARQAVTAAPRSRTTVTIPFTLTTGGSRSIIAVADPQNTLVETNENNNQGSAVLADAGNTVDLEVLPENVTLSSNDLTVGEQLTVTAVVRNRGTTAVRNAPVILAHPEETALGELVRVLVNVAAGTTATVTFPWTTSLTGDPLVLAVQVDPFGLYDELSETNNRADVSLRVRPSAQPNLSVSGADVSFQPDPPLEGGTAAVSAIIRNTGSVTTGSFSVRFYCGDPAEGGTLMGESAVAEIAAHSSSTATVTWSPVNVRGQQGIFVVADALEQIDEFDETDNRAFRPFSVLGLPDLVLTTAALSLDPAFPRSGQPVAIRAAIRNLGGQTSAQSVLRAFEGEAGSGTAIGEAMVPPVEPGQTVTLEVAWTPSAPSGEKTFSVVVDADDQVREQDEGNNTARRQVVVQNADLYLTNVYFSPDGDGAQDTTTLAYRATGDVTIVVSNSSGKLVRTLAERASASGSATWDGRNDAGTLLWDGVYAFTVTGEGGVVLGRASATLDTNRSAIHDTAGTKLSAIRNLTCKLPPYSVVGPAWMPAEDEALFIVESANPDAEFGIGLVRVATDRSTTQVVKDPWFRDASFATADAVSPSGREVLIAKPSNELVAVDLLTGVRRSIGSLGPFYRAEARWSPTGDAIATRTAVLKADGSQLAALADGNWHWSPDGRRLASAAATPESEESVVLTIVRRDGSDARTAPVGKRRCFTGLSWRPDGTISVTVGGWESTEGGPACRPSGVELVDSATLESTTVNWFPTMGLEGDVAWSPDGGKVLYWQGTYWAEPPTKFGLADGSMRMPFFEKVLTVSPDSSIASYQAPACPEKGFSDDIYAFMSLQNLTVDLNATALPANNGILLRGTVADQNLDHFQIEYASSGAPEVWHPAGPASEIPIVDDVFGVLVPPAPGTYLVRLTAVDRAGNTRNRVKVVAWDRTPDFANLSQSEFLISPNDDGVKDTVRFDYLVQIPTRIEVRISGPGSSGPTVRRYSLEYPASKIGPGFFVWDGRNEGGAAVPEGRYTVFVNDLPLRVDVDATPPEIAWSYENLRIKFEDLDAAGKPQPIDPVLVADRLWHVVDPHLRSWQQISVPLVGSGEIFLPEVDGNGEIILEGGKPRIRRIDGRPADRTELEHESGLVNLADNEAPSFEATDVAGNRSELVSSVEERLFLLDARRADDPLNVIFEVPFDNRLVQDVSDRVAFTLVDTVRQEDGVRFQYQALTGGAWIEPPVVAQRNAEHKESRVVWPEPISPTMKTLDELGVPRGVNLRGRFVAHGRTGVDIVTEPFLFRVCATSFDLRVGDPGPIAGSDLAAYTVSVSAVPPEPVTRVTVRVSGLGDLEGFHAEADLELPPYGPTMVFNKQLILPNIGCKPTARILEFSATATGQSGRVYSHYPPCNKLIVTRPLCSSDPRLELHIDQTNQVCENASPDRVLLDVHGIVDSNVVTITRGTEAPVTVGTLTVTPRAGFGQRVVADVAGIPEGDVLFKATAGTLSDKTTVFIDRTPPTAEILEPAEGTEVCPNDLRIAVETSDPGRLSLNNPEFQIANGPWRPMTLRCLEGGCKEDLKGLSVYSWDVSELPPLPSGEYRFRLPYCDQSGFKTTPTRRFTSRVDPPYLKVVRNVSPFFSPNSDNHSDLAIVTIQTDQALRLTAEVIALTRPPTHLRTLVSDQAQPAGDHDFIWDGRDDTGKTASDGVYEIVVTGVNACGLSGTTNAKVELDNTPPVGVIYRPTSGATVRAGVDVWGVATDLHFSSYTLNYGVGTAPEEWKPILAEGRAVPGTADIPGLLAHWDVPRLEGTYTLRLDAKDAAENRTEHRIAVVVGPPVFLDYLRANPAVFSPNGDGRRETTSIEYRLLAEAMVSLDILNSAQSVVRTLENTTKPADGYVVVWDGQTDTATPAPEGEYLARIRASGPLGGPTTEELSIAVLVDRVAPIVTLTEPLAGACVTRDDVVRGSIEDPRLARYAISATPEGGVPLELARGAQSMTDSVLARFSTLSEGSSTLSVTAEDTAENRAQTDVPFTIDSITPQVRLISPIEGAVLRRGSDPIAITGSVTDVHLRDVVLSYGAGENPAHFIEIARSSAGGENVTLGSWSVSSLTDGVYTLRLTGTDCRGLTAEARVTLTLDGTVPRAVIATPAENAYLRAGQPITGTASDQHLESWDLESAPGPVATAYQWSPLSSGTTAVDNAALATNVPLPPDGVHTLRLTVRDRVGLTSTALRSVVVDTTPPAAPTGLAAEVTKISDTAADVHLTWNPNTEPDLAGYKVTRDETLLTSDVIPSPAYTDGARPEGRYRYSVVAIDQAGNVSPPAAITVRVDLTPPIVDILFPRPATAHSGSVDVRGTAFSPDDFKEYRLFVGVGTEPASWTLLKRSTLTVSAGVLGPWMAVGAGPYVLALEAEDISGNQARVTVPVRVDNDAPAAPILTSVTNVPSPDSLTATWEPSTSTDVAGYLVYRNGRIANAPGLVVGDLTAFLVPAPTYVDQTLPDGRHCYRVVAMDQAGNTSPPSNEICADLDNRAPHATIVAPADGSRFEFPVRVVAFTPDLDVATVQFEFKRHADTAWSALGAAIPAEPFETTLDPASLTFGPYDLRAVATDKGGRIDPAPGSITVTYGDTTPPATPRDLVALVDGNEVRLTWTRGAEADLAGYHVERDGTRLTTTLLPDPAYTDTNVPLGPHTYHVIAVDADGNESPPVEAEAVIYALRLNVPYPVTMATSETLAGDGSRDGTTVQILRGTDVVGSAPGPDGNFNVEGVALAEGANELRARGVDGLGNRSIPSNQVLLIKNTAPSAVTGLAAAVTDHDVTLNWDPVGDADLQGYLVRRDGVPLTKSVPQTEAASIQSSADWAMPEWAFDGDPNTAWAPGSVPAEWTVTFPQPVLIDRIGLRFVDYNDPEPFVDYQVQLRWQGRFIPFAIVRGNQETEVEHRLPYAFATDALRVVIETDSYVGLAEVAVSKIDVVPGGVTTYQDPGQSDGVHTYAVSAIDQYGAEGTPASADAAVGDILPPGAPTGLTATVLERDVLLSWDPNPEPDIAHYVVLRDGSRIATTPTPAYRDIGRPNGEYVYTVTAVDLTGLESPESAPANAIVNVAPEPPSAPIIFVPTDSAHPITLDTVRTDVGGTADRGLTVSLDVNGRIAGIVTALDHLTYVESGRTSIVDRAGASTIAPDGKTVAYTWEDETGFVHATLVDVATGATREITHAGYEEVAIGHFSPDSQRLTYEAGTYSDPAAIIDGLYVLHLATDVRAAIEDGADTEGDSAWSPDGHRVAFTASNASEMKLLVRDLEAQTTTPLISVAAPAVMSFLRWSPDGTRLAFNYSATDAGPYELRVLDLGSPTPATLDGAVWPWTPPAWSPDSTRIAYTADGPRVVIRELTTGDLVEVPGADVESVDPRFDSTGSVLSFIRVAADDQGTRLRTYAVSDLGSGDRTTLGSPLAEDHPNAFLLHEPLQDGRLALSLEDHVGFYQGGTGSFEFKQVGLASGENTLVARATDIATGLSSPDSLPVRITVNAESFPDLEVTASDLGTYPPAPIVGQPAAASVRIRNNGPGSARNVAVSVTVMAPSTATVLQSEPTISEVAAGQSVVLSLPWTPATPGTYLLQAAVDPSHLIEETREGNNEAARAFYVAASGAVVVDVRADRTVYPAQTLAVAQVGLRNPGPAFVGTLRLSVEDGAGREVSALDTRTVSIDYGADLSYSVLWNTGTTYAGNYAFRIRLTDADGTERGQASWAFTIQPSIAAAARLTPVKPTVAAGGTASFEARVENRGLNAPLDDLTARLRIRPEASGDPVYESPVTLPRLFPGGLWEGIVAWPAASPAGRYTAELIVSRADGSVLATASAPFEVVAASVTLQGTLVLDPADILSGGVTHANLTVTNLGTADLPGSTVAVEVTSGADATVLVREAVTIDLPAGEARVARVALGTSALTSGAYPAFLRVSDPARTLDRTVLRVHGAITPPSIDSPADGSTVNTSHPTLCVNNAVSVSGATLTYEFEVYSDMALQQSLTGATAIVEGQGRTCWYVRMSLAEDETVYWRVRAGDGFSFSPYTPVASFKVDERNEAPSAPVPQTPLPDARVDTLQPTLTVTNAQDPENDPLTYEIRVATDADMTQVVTSISGLPEGSMTTSWKVPVSLVEDARYFWSARANDGRAYSPWSLPIAFIVDATNASPTAPVPIRPIGGATVATQTPELVVENAVDPEGGALTYAFEVDRVSSFDSADLQVSLAIPESEPETAWTPPNPLPDNTLCYWRAAASDGNSQGPWANASFFVNLGNEPPTAPVSVDPAEGQVVTTLTPSFRVRNAVDPDNDVLTYEFSVVDLAGNVLASMAGVPETAVETSWTTPTPLVEDDTFRWTARAHDGQVAGPWSATVTFRVNAVQEPPTAPTIISPAEGDVLTHAAITLVVGNASSTDGLPLTYTFELYAVGSDGSLTLRERVDSVAEGAGATSWSPSQALPDGAYAWRCQAVDPIQAGPWTPTAHFRVAVDVPPAPPTGLSAVPGDAQVALAWNANGEPDVVGYRVHRSLTAGGPYDFVAATTVPAYVDTGLTNGVTVFYVVTAVDASFESGKSAEVAATPTAVQPHVDAEIRYIPSTISGECLLRGHRHYRSSAKSGRIDRARDDENHCHPEHDCPWWIYATIELPAGLDPATIDVRTVRLAGNVAADPQFERIVDYDHDRIYEKKVRFPFAAVLPLLSIGSNQLEVTGKAGSADFRGSAIINVTPMPVQLWITPRTLNKGSQGTDVQASITFPEGVSASQVAIESLRLNETVPVHRVVTVHHNTLVVKFDRAAVAAILPLGNHVEVRVSGTIGPILFTGRDHIRVIAGCGK